MTWRTLDVSTDDRGVMQLTLNTPERRNILSPQMIAELTELAGTLDQVRAVVLSGAGPTFCAGGDLAWMHAQILADRPQRLREARKLAEMLQALNTLPVPLIGRLHGGAFGGGVGLACVCDVVLASPETKFGMTETRLGIIPATIGPYVIARMGEGRARRVFMSGRIFDAAEAETLGIVSRVVAPEAMAAAIDAEVLPYLSAAPASVKAAKSFARALGPRIDGDIIEKSVHQLVTIWESPEARIGVEAFLKKEEPPWKL
jgi:methylglutaconyl-CoA hydratase